MSKNTAIEITAGSIGGVVQVLVGQPFDTIKVRLQSQPSPPIYRGMLDCLLKTVRNEGLFALYKGTLSPLAGIAFCTSIQFSTLEQMKRTYKDLNGTNILTPSQLYISGGIAGLTNSFVAGPVEHVRTRMQIQDSNNRLYRSTWNCLQTIYRDHGIAGVYKGQVITMLREWQGYGSYFLVYELLVQRAKQISGKDQLRSYEIMAYGALAGYGMWIPVFPLDSIKSRIQTDDLDPSKRKYRGWVDCLMKVAKTEGIKGLYRGFLPCLLRAAPVNASTFLAYEYAKKKLSGDS